MNDAVYQLHTSLLRARLSTTAPSPLTEHQFVEYVCAMVGVPDLARAVYVGLKAQFAVCVHGVPVAQSMALADAFAAAVVGANSEQIVKVPFPASDDHVARRFAAMRLAEVVASALDEAQRDKMFFVLVHGDDGKALMAWVRSEITSTLHAETADHDAWPRNLVVLGAAHSVPARLLRPWLALRAPAPMPATEPQSALVPPVGYQRQFIANRLHAASVPWQWGTGMLLAEPDASVPPAVAWRWLAAATDKQGHGLWLFDDPHGNAEQALAALHSFTASAAR